MQSHDLTLVSNSLLIGEKRETNGNEHGNEAETKAASLCRNGNEMETKDGNESRLSVALVSNRDKITEQPFLQIRHPSSKPPDDDASGSLQVTPRPVRKLSRPSKHSVMCRCRLS
jgi:hypothetical protein